MLLETQSGLWFSIVTMENQNQTKGYQIMKHKDGRFFNVIAPDGALVCVAVYRKGAEEVIRRLMQAETGKSVAA